MKRLLFLLPVLLFVGVAIFFGVGLTRDPSKIPSMLIDRPLPVFDLPPVIAGERGFGSHTLRGEPALLNIFASWCVACRVEHPLLMRLKEDGVPIYGLDWKDKAADGARWLGAFGNPYRLAANDEPGRVGIDLGVTGVPETFVVDRSGRVRYKHIGPISPDDWDNVLKPMLEKLKAES